MKKFLKFIKDSNLVGFILGALLSTQLGMDPGTAKVISGAAEQASDQAIERVLTEEE